MSATHLTGVLPKAGNAPVRRAADPCPPPVETAPRLNGRSNPESTRRTRSGWRDPWSDRRAAESPTRIGIGDRDGRVVEGDSGAVGRGRKNGVANRAPPAPPGTRPMRHSAGSCGGCRAAVREERSRRDTRICGEAIGLVLKDLSSRSGAISCGRAPRNRLGLEGRQRAFKKARTPISLSGQAVVSHLIAPVHGCGRFETVALPSVPRNARCVAG